MRRFLLGASIAIQLDLKEAKALLDELAA